MLSQRLSAAADGPAPRRAEAGAVFVIAGLEGLMLERLDRGETATLDSASKMFVAAATAVLARD